MPDRVVLVDVPADDEVAVLRDVRRLYHVQEAQVAREALELRRDVLDALGAQEALARPQARCIRPQHRLRAMFFLAF